MTVQAIENTNTKPASHPALAEVMMTDAAMLAMPENAYMNTEQCAFFRQRLENMKTELSHAETRAKEAMRHSEMSADPVDRATTEESHALELLTRDRDAKLFGDVQKAIVRIDSGTYGFCEESGEPIGIARLLAQPTARMTTDAQQRRERLRRTFAM